MMTGKLLLPEDRKVTLRLSHIKGKKGRKNIRSMRDDSLGLLEDFWARRELLNPKVKGYH